MRFLSSWSGCPRNIVGLRLRSISRYCNKPDTMEFIINIHIPFYRRPTVSNPLVVLMFSMHFVVIVPGYPIVQGFIKFCVISKQEIKHCHIYLQNSIDISYKTNLLSFKLIVNFQTCYLCNPLKFSCLSPVFTSGL